MVATLYLFACALATAQPGPVESSDWQLTPHLSQGHELVYRGSYTEEAVSPGVQFCRSYWLEARTFVFNVVPQGTEVAFFTVWKGQPSSVGARTDREVKSARVELARVDPNGRVVPAPGRAITVPLESPPPTETGAFVEAPRGRLRPDQTWLAPDGDKPARTWQVNGMEPVNGTRCVKLVGVQQSEDWDSPRADHTGWRRRDTVWMAPRFGVAYRVERVIERRDPGHTEPTQRTILRYEIESTLQYPGQLYDDRRHEIELAYSLAENVYGLVPRAGQVGPQVFDAIIKRIEYHNEHQPPTPYREAIAHVQKLAEAGKRGDTPPVVIEEPTTPTTGVLTYGRRAPDFLVSNFDTHESARLRTWIGKPILMVFYTPTAPSAREVLKFAKDVSERNADKVTVLGFALADDDAPVINQREEMGVKFPVLSGKGMTISYNVEGTPKLVVLDANGIMRNAYTGWGPEIPGNVTADLIRCLQMKK